MASMQASRFQNVHNEYSSTATGVGDVPALFILGTVNRNVLRLGASLGKPNTLATNTRKFDNVMCVCTRKAVDGRVVVVDTGVVVLPWKRLRPVPVLVGHGN